MVGKLVTTYGLMCKFLLNVLRNMKKLMFYVTIYKLINFQTY